MIARVFRELWRALSQVAVVSLNPVLADVIGYRTKNEKRDRAELEEKLDELTLTMQRSADLVAEVEAELSVRRAAVEQLKTDAEAARNVAQLSEEQRQAVALILRGAVAKEGRKTFWLGALVNLLFFVAGVGVTLLVGR